MNASDLVNILTDGATSFGIPYNELVFYPFENIGQPFCNDYRGRFAGLNVGNVLPCSKKYRVVLGEIVGVFQESVSYPSPLIEGGVVVVPATFFTSMERGDIDLRDAFFRIYRILRVNLFEVSPRCGFETSLLGILFSRAEKENRVQSAPWYRFVIDVPETGNDATGISRFLYQWEKPTARLSDIRHLTIGASDYWSFFNEILQFTPAPFIASPRMHDEIKQLGWSVRMNREYRKVDKNESLSGLVASLHDRVSFEQCSSIDEYAAVRGEIGLSKAVVNFSGPEYSNIVWIGFSPTERQEKEIAWTFNMWLRNKRKETFSLFLQERRARHYMSAELFLRCLLEVVRSMYFYGYNGPLLT